MEIDSNELKRKIRDLAKRNGFVGCGFTSTDSMPAYEKSKVWINNGYHRKMAYLENHLPLKRGADKVFSGAQTVFVGAFPYGTGDKTTPPLIAGYALGEDYHLILKKKLKFIAEEIIKTVGGKYFIAVDSMPVAERYFAQKAGIGWIGKSGNLIVHDFGPNVVLGEIILEAKILPDKPSTQNCGDCRICIDSCPTGAIVEDGIIDSGRCLSYYTTECREIPGDDIKSQYNGRLFGCETCVSSCPHTTPIMLSTPAFKPDELIELADISFKSRLKNSALSHISKRKIMANSILALITGSYNLDFNEYFDKLRKLQDPRINEILDWSDKNT